MIPLLLTGIVVVLYSVYVAGRMFESTPKGNFYRFCSQYNSKTKLTYREVATILSNYEKAEAIEIHDVDFDNETSTMKVLVTYHPVWFPFNIVRPLSFEVTND